jgi:Superinfection immunity protein
MDSVTLIRVVSGMLALFVIPLYFLPAILARKKQQFVAILLLNIFLGWTFIGWL